MVDRQRGQPFWLHQPITIDSAFPHIMKQNALKSILLALLATGGLALPLTRATAAVNFVPGDILVGFQATGGVGAGNTYVYNLGQATVYRNNPEVGFIANIQTDLDATFGSGWYGRSDVKWSIGGVRENATFGSASTTVVDGDPARAIYVSKTSTGIGASTPHGTLSSANVNTTATKMMDSQSGFRTSNGTTPRNATATSGGNGVVQGTGDINNWKTVVPSTGAPWTTMDASVTGSFGTANSFAYLDLYRALSNNSGLGGVVEPTATGVFTYQTTFTIDALGNISAVPEPSTSLFAGSIACAAFMRRRRRSA